MFTSESNLMFVDENVNCKQNVFMIDPAVIRLESEFSKHKWKSKTDFRNAYSEYAGRNITSQHYNNWRHRGIPHRELHDVAAFIGVRLEWLRDGIPPKYTQDGHDLVTPEPAAHEATDMDTLMNLATPRSRASITKIAQAAQEGRLSDADLALLEQIADRFIGNREEDSFLRRIKEKRANDDPDTGA